MPPAEALPPVMPGDAELDPRLRQTAEHASGGGFVVRLPRAPDAARAARAIVRTRFADVLAQDTLDDAVLVVSELVTNAVQHGAGEIELRVGFDGQCVTGDVTDEGARFAQSKPPQGPGQIGGRGLYLVARIADSWGVREGPSHVWFEILAPSTD